jgi:DNA polymerase-3 subunit beta
MNLEISRKKLLEPLKTVANATEQKGSIPIILSNVLMQVDGDTLRLTGGDNEITISHTIAIDDGNNKDGQTTVHAKKLNSILQNLIDDNLSFSIAGNKATLIAGKSKFSLSCLPATDYPVLNAIDPILTINLKQKELKKLLSSTAYAMAIGDPRFYLNGVCFDFTGETLNVVATDGHRLALDCLDMKTDNDLQVIIPVKAVIELQKSIGNNEEIIEISISENEFQAKITDNLVIRTRLIDGKFPDYHGVIPQVEFEILLDLVAFKSSLSQVKTLSHQTHKGAVLAFSKNKMLISAKNTSGEEASCEIDIKYDNDPIEIGFNITYLLDALYAIPNDNIAFGLRDESYSCVISPSDDDKVKMVVMPMRI